MQIFGLEQIRLHPKSSPAILILDDEIDVGQALARDLRNQAEVQLFQQPEAALAALKLQTFSAILSDFRMPQMDGLQFLSQCNERTPNTPRILITAFTDLLDVEKMINKAHLFSLLTKPWEAEDLQKVVAHALRVHQYTVENEELRRLAWTDALTGVANHRYFWERMESEFSRAQRFGRSLSLMMCDVDDFKKFNDTHGHQHGDQVLHRVAQTLEYNKRSMDTVARYGGEEFAVILPEVSRARAIEIAKRHLRATLNQTGVSMSIGVASFPEDCTSSTELVHCSDLALLQAKKLGKQRVVSAVELVDGRLKS